MLWVGEFVTFSLHFLLLCSQYTEVKSDLNPAENDSESPVRRISSVEVRIFLSSADCHVTKLSIPGESSDQAREEEPGL